MTKLSMVVKSGDFNDRYKGRGLARAATGRSRTNGFNSHRNEPRKKRSFLHLTNKENTMSNFVRNLFLWGGGGGGGGIPAPPSTLSTVTENISF